MNILMETRDLDADGKLTLINDRKLVIDDIGHGETLVVLTNGEPYGLSDDNGESVREIIALMTSANSGETAEEVKEMILHAIPSSEGDDATNWIKHEVECYCAGTKQG